jgi:serine/threonine protein kinase
MEIVNGGELFDRIVKKTFYNEKEARDLIAILLSAIKHCHDRHIVHR